MVFISCSPYYFNFTKESNMQNNMDNNSSMIEDSPGVRRLIVFFIIISLVENIPCSFLDSIHKSLRKEEVIFWQFGVMFLPMLLLSVLY